MCEFILKINKRYLIGAGVISVVFALFFTVGLYCSRLYNTSFYPHTIPNSVTGYIFFCTIQVVLMLPIFYFIIHFLMSHSKCDDSVTIADINGGGDVNSETAKNGMSRFSYKVFVISAGVILLVYCFYLYACYPGFYGYDAGVQIPQVMYKEVPYSAHHPLLHTLIMGGLVNWGYHLKPESLKFGLFIYNLFQVFVCSLTFAFSLEYVYRISKNRILYVISLMFYLFCPAIVLFSLSTTKDSLCCCCLMIGLILWYQILNEEQASIRKWIFCGIFLVFACLFRNNIIVAIVLLAGVSLLLISNNRKKYILFYVTVILLSIAINRMLLFILQASSISSIEMLSVPIQQIARLYVEKGPSAFSDEELDLINKLTMIGNNQGLEYYSPFLSDPVKYAFNQNSDELKNHLIEFLLIWIKKGFQYPKIYFMAFCANTYQAWYPATSVYSAYGYNYFERGFDDEYFRQPKIKSFYDWLCNMYIAGNYRNVFGLRIIASMGTYFCFMLFSIVMSILRKNRKQLVVLMALVMVCLTYLAGPLSSIRYYLILFYFAPMMGLFNLGNK